MRKMMKTLCSSVALIALLATGMMLLTPGLGGAEPMLAKEVGSAQTTEMVDLNTASKNQLQSLPGIGRLYSQRIVENRPYASKEDLLDRGIVPKGTFSKIQDKVTVSK